MNHDCFSSESEEDLKTFFEEKRSCWYSQDTEEGWWKTGTYFHARASLQSPLFTWKNKMWFLQFQESDSMFLTPMLL
jgi:hypothetical protein